MNGSLNPKPKESDSQYESLTSEIRFGRPTTILSIVGVAIVLGIVVMMLLPRRTVSVANEPAKTEPPSPPAASNATVENTASSPAVNTPPEHNSTEPPGTNQIFWTELNDQLKLTAQQYRALRDNNTLLESTLRDLLQSKTGKSIAVQSDLVARFTEIHYRHRMTPAEFDTIRMNLERWQEVVNNALPRPRRVPIDHGLKESLDTLREEMVNANTVISTDLQALQSIVTAAAPFRPGAKTLEQTIAIQENGYREHRDPATLSAEEAKNQMAREEGTLYEEIDRRVKRADFGRSRRK